MGSRYKDGCFGQGHFVILSMVGSAERSQDKNQQLVTISRSSHHPITTFHLRAINTNHTDRRQRRSLKEEDINSCLTSNLLIAKKELRILVFIYLNSELSRFSIETFGACYCFSCW